jgi:hypothetical protein
LAAGFLSWWTTARVGATVGSLAALAAFASALSAIRTLRQARRDSAARSRPMVAAELRDDAYADAVQLLVVTNYGPTIARNVAVSFDPPIPDPANPRESVAPFLKRRYASPIAVMPPGMSLDNIYFSGELGPDGLWFNTEPTPEQVVVSIAYENDAGKRFVDKFPLDTNLIRQRTYVTSSKAPDQQRKETIKILKQIAAALERRTRAHDIDTTA